MKFSFVFITTISLLAQCFVASGQPAQNDKDSTMTEGRAVWVTRWQFKSPEDVARIMENCATMHFNTVFFQVRGEGTVFYRSKIEPWAWELTSSSPLTTGKDPGWDPLQVAVEQAHARGLKIHAWMNVFPGWRGQEYPPAEAKQLWTEHPDWFMMDKTGNKMIPRDSRVQPGVGTWYSFINPAHPRVQEYVPKVFLEVVQNYDVDGINYDYVRYPSEIDDFSYDPASRGRFKEETGGTPESNPQEWIDWRAEQVTKIVRTIYQEATKIKPQLVVSGAVIGAYDRARTRYFARSQEWLKEGILDIAVPMNYTAGTTFTEQAKSFVQNKGKGHVYVGMSGGGGRRSRDRNASETTPDTAMENAPQLHQQINIVRQLGADGVAVFSYSSLVGENGELNEQGRGLADGPFKRAAEIPPMPWKAAKGSAPKQGKMQPTSSEDERSTGSRRRGRGGR